jgi:NAD(P)-dependent dehydrogenase (short-subunit alcohol dehydrogenase family)
MAPVAETTLDDFRKMTELNGTTCFLCCRESVRAMRRSDGAGRIVNVTARPVLEPTSGMLAYTASKAMVAAITRAIDAETRSEGILANAVVPSIIDTPANRAAMPDADHERWPKPAQIAATIAHIASPANALTGGALIPVYGRS